LDDAGLVLARAKFASVAAGQIDTAVVPIVMTEQEMLEAEEFWAEEQQKEQAEMVRLSELAQLDSLIRINEEPDNLFDDEEKQSEGGAAESEHSDSDGSDDEEDMTSGQEMIALENDIAHKMTGSEGSDD
jgi:hypothetical protein